MDAFIQAAQTVVSGSNEERCRAEASINTLIEHPDALDTLLRGLYEVDEMVFFFILIGIQRVIWKRWRFLTEEDKNRLSGVIIDLILTKSDSLQKFSQSKLEQILANICAQAGSLEPVIQVLNAMTGGGQAASGEEASDEGLAKVRKKITGLSALSTVLDEALNMEDPRLTLEQRKAVSSAAANMVVPATTLACTIISESLTITTSLASSGEGLQGVHARALNTHFYSSRVALETIRVIMVRIEMGPHVTPQVLDLLFAVAKLGLRGASSFNGVVSGGEVEEVSKLAMECLHELMLKRYIPNNGGGSGSGTSDTLMFLANNSLGVLQEFLQSQRSTGGHSSLDGSLEQPDMLVPVLSFLSAFSSTHLERCLKQGQPGQKFVLNLISCLVEVGLSLGAGAHPDGLVRLTSLWADLLDLDDVREYVLENEELAESISRFACYLLSSSLLSQNSTLRLEYSLELLEACTDPEPFVDPHIRECVHTCFLGDTSRENSYNSDKKGGGTGLEAVLGREEESSAVGSLRNHSLHVLNILAGSDCASDALGKTCMRYWDNLNERMGVTESAVNKASDASGTPSLMLGSHNKRGDEDLASDIPVAALLALDQVFLVKVLPLHIPSSSLLLQLSSLLSVLANTRFFSIGGAQATLWVEVCLVLVQLSTTFCNEASYLEIANTIVNIVPVLSPSLSIACDFRIVPPPRDVTNAVLVLAMSFVTHARAAFEKADRGEGPPDVNSAVLRARQQLAECANEQLLAASSASGLHLESYALLSIVTDEVSSCRALVTNLHALSSFAASLDSALAQLQAQDFQPQGNTASAVAYYRALATMVNLSPLSRMLCSVTASVKHINLARNERKKATLEALQTHYAMLVSLAGSLFAALKAGLALSHRHGGPSCGGGGLSVSVVAAQLLGLVEGLLQSFGAKAAKEVSVTIFGEAVFFVQHAVEHSNSANNLSILHEGTSQGCALVSQMLALAQTIARSSSSGASTGASQVSALSLALLEGISSTMAANNPHSRKVVAELLKPLLSTGAILVGCYWKRKKNKSTFLGAAVGAPAPASEPDEPTGGTQCQAIILLLSRLSVASLTAAEVPPDDVLVSVEGLSSIIQDKYLLSVTWFVVHPECWPTLLRTVLHCLLYRVHVVHKGPLEDLLVLLVSDLDFAKLQEEIQSGEALASQEELNQLASLSRGDSGVANMAKGTGDGDTLPASAPRELDGVLQQVMMEIEALVGSQGSSIADAGTTFFAQFQAAKQASQSDGPGPFQQSFGARATSGTAKGRRSREVKLLLATVIQPLSAEIAKLQDPNK